MTSNTKDQIIDVTVENLATLTQELRLGKYASVYELIDTGDTGEKMWLINSWSRCSQSFILKIGDRVGVNPIPSVSYDGDEVCSGFK